MSASGNSETHSSEGFSDLEDSDLGRDGDLDDDEYDLDGKPEDAIEDNAVNDVVPLKKRSRLFSEGERLRTGKRPRSLISAFQSSKQANSTSKLPVPPRTKTFFPLSRSPTGVSANSSPLLRPPNCHNTQRNSSIPKTPPSTRNFYSSKISPTAKAPQSSRITPTAKTPQSSRIAPTAKTPQSSRITPTAKTPQSSAKTLTPNAGSDVSPSISKSLSTTPKAVNGKQHQLHKENGPVSEPISESGAVMSALKDVTSLLNTLVKRVEGNSKDIKSIQRALKDVSSSSSSDSSKKRQIPSIVRVSKDQQHVGNVVTTS